MRAGVRLIVAARKISTVILLGVVTIAMVIPVSDVAMGQGGTGAQPPLYTVKDLHPSGFANSQAFGIADGQQVGTGWGPSPEDQSRKHALLWRGTPASLVDLTPSGFDLAEAVGVSAGRQVGFGNSGNRRRALLWSGSATSVVDLTPQGFSFAVALGISGTQQVGSGINPAGGNNLVHALLWSSGGVVDLHPVELRDSAATATSGGQQVGEGTAGSGPTAGLPHALLWSGSSASVVDLHPTGFDSSRALGVSGGQQVGFGSPSVGGFHALLWRGSAGSVVDLNGGFDGSAAFGTNGTQQVGAARTGGRNHALVWNGSASKVVDLHRFLPSGFTDSQATAIDSKGNIVGSAFNGSNFHAFLWMPSSVPVVILPGIPGSWPATGAIVRVLQSRGLRNFSIAGVRNEIRGMIGTHLLPRQMVADPVYDDLVNTLKSTGVDVFVMPWDWANGGFQKAAADLDQFIRDQSFDKVDIIAHSAGGLVALQYLQDRLTASADPHVRNLILLGTPNQGTLTAHCGYYDEPFACAAGNTEAQLEATRIQVMLNISAFPADALQFTTRIDTLAQTMPTFPYLQRLIPPNGPLFTVVNNTYLRGLNGQTLSSAGKFQSAGITLYTVRGTGVPTPRRFVVIPNPAPESRRLKPFLVLFADRNNLDGDDSVLAQSAAIPGFNDVPVPNATHVRGLLDCIKEAYPRVRDTGTLACAPQPRRANTYVYIQTGSPVRILLADPRGRLTGTDFATGADAAAIPASTFFQGDHPGIFIDDAVQGKYSLDVLGTGTGGAFTLAIAFPNAFPNGLDITEENFSGRIAPGQRLRFTFDTFAFQGVTSLFAAFGARLEINSASRAFEMNSTFTLGSGGTISPAAQPMSIELGGAFLVVIPAGSFRAVENGRKFVFEGTVNGVALEANLTPTGGNSYSLKIEGAGARNVPRANPVEVRLGIGNHGGSVSVNAEFDR